MGARSAIIQLPEAVRLELDRRLVQSGFSGFRELSEWLAEQGFEVSKSAVHRYGQTFEAKLDRLRLVTEQARALVQVSPDEEGAVTEALVRLAQERMFGVLVELGDDVEPATLAKLTRAVADVARASVTSKRFVAEVQVRAQAAADEAEAIGRKGGLSDEAIDTIKSRILGIVG